MFKVRRQFELVAGSQATLEARLFTLEAAVRARKGAILSVVREHDAQARRATVRYEVDIEEPSDQAKSGGSVA